MKNTSQHSKKDRQPTDLVCVEDVKRLLALADLLRQVLDQDELERLQAEFEGQVMNGKIGNTGVT